MARRFNARSAAAKRNRAKRRGLTPEGRAALQAAALRNRPWEASTGPRTETGKRSSSGNAVKHGRRSWALLPDGVRAAYVMIRDAERSGGMPDLGAVSLAIDALRDYGDTFGQLRGLALLSRACRQTLRAISE